MAAEIRALMSAGEIGRRIPNSVSSDNDRLDALAAAVSSEFDAAFEYAGYAIPVDTTGDAGLAAYLREQCARMVLIRLRPGVATEKSVVDRDYEELVAWLDDIRMRRQSLPGVARANRVRFGWVDTSTKEPLCPADFEVVVP